MTNPTDAEIEVVRRAIVAAGYNPATAPFIAEVSILALRAHDRERGMICVPRGVAEAIALAIHDETDIWAGGLTQLDRDWINAKSDYRLSIANLLDCLSRHIPLDAAEKEGA